MNLPAVIRRSARAESARAVETAAWLQQNMSPFFFEAMADEQDALAWLARDMPRLRINQRVILVDRAKLLVVACVSRRGTLYDTLRRIGEREISYAMFSHSFSSMPDMEEELEVQRFEFDRRQNHEIDLNRPIDIPSALAGRIRSELRTSFPGFDLKKFDRLLKIFWLNNQNYVRMSPPSRTAYLLWLFERSNEAGGLFLDIAEVVREGRPEIRVLFAVGNPPQEEFLRQVLEVFNRLEIGIRRAYCQTISNGIHPYFLGAFYVQSRTGADLSPGSPLAAYLRRELCTTQIVSTVSPAYRDFVTTGLLSGEDAALTNAFIAFCHTSLAHNQPDRFGLEDVQRAFYDHPEMGQLLIRLFRARFNPELTDREALYDAMLAETQEAVEGYNTGHRWLDDIRRSVYRCCLLLITHCLKTNFFVVEKQALAFRLDPAYLRKLGSEFIADLPEALPFRVTFFFSRYGAGYHIGFSDIARGGWRTVIARSADDFITAANTLFREVYVLANTQHLKNKDIYEGGSKLTLVLDASDLSEAGGDEENCRLYKLQYSIANAFLDIFVTADGRARDQRVVDYYGDDEPIEIGPDENMHDSMIEAIASLSRRRGYILGTGIMSSKRVGINHKEYGVTSTGVVTFARITMAESLGVDIDRDTFSLKMTGGPNGDVAGNCLRIMLARCPGLQVRLILDGTAAVYDPGGLHRQELERMVLKHDLDSFDPERLNPGGFIIYRTGRRMEGLKETHRKVSRSVTGMVEEWLDIDDFYHQYNSLVFSVPADLFIPAGGRPETIEGHNWRQFLDEQGKPSARVIVEGANSFLTPEARVQLQKSGAVIMRDASANKCGVISSSYEIIANLLLSEREFLEHKEEYVGDVLSILEKRAADEARLILRRWREAGGTQLYTEISDTISQNINAYYTRLFEFFSNRPALCLQMPFRQAVINHLPLLLRKTPAFRRRISTLPTKYLCAILAAEIGSSLIYTGNRDEDFEEMITRHLARIFRRPGDSPEPQPQRADR
ncbi:NAD-glutamate dehydrogenase domain-containing protein [Geobacter sp. SVR]|uniref:NAD-glutamate dehydrogenase domain-containing protein n=1 Tax=Geobacter sp. SVR TaxID=2495594 RepID=UPI00143EFE46|nr:NAD-glutamate dehydrogenase domain-containing protein [Geobacter sp. SVR]BCS55853.1 amino acid dehydrogenase [Geobacter sp. SVR]GCF83857.1 amino acid dehydrogenase [Geobacter sp. SVR]